MRNVLLLEPNYKNKYPPIGLMKLATYHRMLGDNVVFYKGDLKDFLLTHISERCIEKLSNIDSSINWNLKFTTIKQYIKTKNRSLLINLDLENSRFEILLLTCLREFKDFYWKKKYIDEPYWDRICVTTLFTFYWKISLDTIEFAKQLVKKPDELWVGGVLASVIPEKLQKATHIKNIFQGLLNKPGILDDNNIVIDELPLDYSILDEIDYNYSESSAYYGYMTRGCIRKCSFCAVPILEPEFNPHIPLNSKISDVKEKYGEKRNLLLLDNNVLASECFPEIIAEIKKNGFKKGVSYIEPNLLEISIRNLQSGINDRAYKRKAFFLINDLIRRLRGATQQNYYNILDRYELLKCECVSKENLINAFKEIKDIYEKHRNKAPKLRYVDFNQGVDARLINKQNIKLLSQIPINPLRIAFDSMNYKEVYVNAVELAAKHGINSLSNYLLYNHNDKPLELYQRMRINVELCEKLDISIYSFPMKFHPIDGEFNLNRDYLGKHWNRKFIRAIQTVLNATKGKIGRGLSFFDEAFGNDEDEFLRILYMPETYILYRLFFKDKGYTDSWWKAFSSLTEQEQSEAKVIIEKNDFNNINGLTTNPSIINVLKHYTVTRDDFANKKIQKKLKVVDIELELIG